MMLNIAIRFKIDKIRSDPTISRLRHVTSLLTLLGALLWAQSALAQSADPMQLPVASRQTPDWDAYTMLGVRTAPAGTFYNDPVTGVPVYKATSASMPAPNSLAYHDYSEGGPVISRDWGNGEHTILIRLDSGDPWLGDYQRGAGITNWRQFPPEIPYPISDLQASFSNVAGTARIMFYVSDGKLFRFNTESMQLEGESSIPQDGLPIPGVESGRLEWLQISKDDEWLVFQSCPLVSPCIRDKVHAFNRVTGILFERIFSNLDEPHLDRDGKYVVVLDGGGGDPTCPPQGPENSAEEYWHLWILDTDTVECRGPAYGGHMGWVRGYFPEANPNTAVHENFYYDPITDTKTITAQYADTNAFIPSHRAGQWIQDVADTTQWYWGSNYDDGQALPTGWSLCVEPECTPGGQIYTTGINWNGVYQKDLIGIQAVYQTDSVDPNLQRYTLSPVGSVTSMAEGTFVYDGASERLYVWARLGGDPTGRVEIFAPTPVHRGIGVRRVDGTEVRLLAHNYSWVNGYRDIPFATTSPDGKLIVFTSNMGKRLGRRDVFIAEVPLAGPLSTPQNVIWTDLINVTVTGNVLTKTSGCDGCQDAGAVSMQQIDSGDGFVEFTASETTTTRAFGLSQGNTDTTGADIDFAILLRGDTQVPEIWENGVYKYDWGAEAYSTGDVFRIAVEGGIVKYYKNGALRYSSSGVPTYPLLADTTFFTLNATISDAIIGNVQ